MMKTTTRRRIPIQVGAVAVLVAIFAGACTSSSDDAMTVAYEGEMEVTTTMAAGGGADTAEGIPGEKALFAPIPESPIDAKVIRDGRIGLRIEPGTFASVAARVRGIASDLGGYVASGESTIEELDDERYAVGWFTIRIPSDRFDDAVARTEDLGERVSTSLSSQDVTEEYVDLQGRLAYWHDQEAFYSRLMDEATTIDDLVAIQTRMQDVLLNIEQTEGRLRYLDGRTQFATLTVEVTEVPGATVTDEPVEQGPIAAAFDQAGEVLLATVAFLIVAAAVVIPIGMLALFVWLLIKLFLGLRRRPTPTES